MNTFAIRSSRAASAAACLFACALGASSVNAGVVVQFTGLNMVYDGSSLRDAGSPAGGLANPGDADGLASLDFFDNGSLVGSLSSDIWLDIFLPGVSGISAATGSVTNIDAVGGGFFDLLIGTSPLASEFLLVDTASMSVTFIDVAGIVQFTFGATLSDVFAQNLPFGLIINDAVTVSFSLQIDPGTLTTSNGVVTGFRASGTGEFAEVPAPAPALALAAGGAIFVRRRRVQR